MLISNQITLTYDLEKEPVIAGLDVSVQAGSFIGLIGANGAGKSTLMLALSGQFRPVSGAIFYKERDIYAENRWYKQRMGFVHEQPFFYDHLNIEEFLHFIAVTKQCDPARIQTNIDAILTAVQLEHERHKRTTDLSLGMRKKLAIASAFLGEPDIVFLDEALNGVDMESAFQIKSLMRDYVARGGAIILSTHVVEVVEKICERYILLKKGRIIGDLTPSQLSSSDSADFESSILRLLKTA